MIITNVVKRSDLAKLIDELGLKVGVEIGVCEGGFSDTLLTNSKLEKLYSIDAWSTTCEDTKSCFKKWAIRKGQVEQAYETTKKKLAKYGERSEVIRSLSFDAVKRFSDNQLDFIYIDASHRFTGFALDMIQWWPKVRWGGLFSGHDYVNRYRFEVQEVVNGFMVEHKQLFDLTTDDVDRRGKNTFPSSWWCIKTQNSKKQFLDSLPSHYQKLLKRKQILKEKGLIVTLPYQYHVMTDMHEEEESESFD